MRLKTIVATLIGLIGPLSLSFAQSASWGRRTAAPGASLRAPTVSQMYFDPQGRFRMSVPTGWTSAAVNKDSVSFVHGDSYITLTVANGQFDLAALMSSIAEQAGKQWRGFTEVSRGETSLSGQRGISIVYIGTNPRGVEASLQLVTAVLGGNTFVFLLSAPKAGFESIGGAFAQMQRSFAVSVAATQSAPGNEPIQAVALPMTRVGDFVLGLPQGWSMTASPGGDVIQMRSRGTEQPSVYVMVTSVSDLRFEASLDACSKHPVNLSYDIFSQCTVPSVRTQLNDSSQEWGPQTAFPLILQRLHGGAAQFGNPMLTPTSAAQAFYRVTATSRIGRLENWGIITMVYVPNPMLGPGKVTSLAMIFGCTAPSDQANGFRPTCSSVIDSFRADPNWFNRLAQGIESIYDREQQILIRMGKPMVEGAQTRQLMIASFGQSMQQMQYETFETIQAANYKTMQNEIAVLGGRVLMRDPDGGPPVSLPDVGGPMCKDAAGNYRAGQACAGLPPLEPWQ
jgi:hypothetical protein